MPNKLSQFIFSGVGVPKLESYLDLSSFRQKLVAGNIANVSTPGYSRGDIDFKSEYSRLIDDSPRLSGVTTHSAHIPTGQHPDKEPNVERTRVRTGELNYVDIDVEMATQAKTELEYTVAARLLQRKFQSLRNAIKSK